MTNAVLAKLRALVTGSAVEECELCEQRISVEHEHLLEPEARRVLCTCQECAALFLREEQRQNARYLRVERRARRLHDIEIDDSEWAALGVPAGLAFFTGRSRTGEVVATFPGREGIVESFVPLKAWSELEQRFASVKSILPDVEALLVRRSSRQHDFFHVSIDHCYELSAILRGAAAPQPAAELGAVQGFFAQLDERAGQKRHSRRPSSS